MPLGPLKHPPPSPPLGLPTTPGPSFFKAHRSWERERGELAGTLDLGGGGGGGGCYLTGVAMATAVFAMAYLAGTLDPGRGGGGGARRRLSSKGREWEEWRRVGRRAGTVGWERA